MPIALGKWYRLSATFFGHIGQPSSDVESLQINGEKPSGILFTFLEPYQKLLTFKNWKVSREHTPLELLAAKNLITGNAYKICLVCLSNVEENSSLFFTCGNSAWCN